jgi:hypothetical protein
MYQNNAKELFLAFVKKPFLHENCCAVLDKMPRFNPEMADHVNDEEGIILGSDIDSSSRQPSPINAVSEVMGQHLARPQGLKAAKLAKHKPDYTTKVLREHVAAIRPLNTSTLDLLKNVRDKACQESDINLAMMNYKMGKQTECNYHIAMHGC